MISIASWGSADTSVTFSPRELKRDSVFRSLLIIQLLLSCENQTKKLFYSSLLNKCKVYPRYHPLVGIFTLCNVTSSLSLSLLTIVANLFSHLSPFTLLLSTSFFSLLTLLVSLSFSQLHTSVPEWRNVPQASAVCLQVWLHWEGM